MKRVCSCILTIAVTTSVSMSTVAGLEEARSVFPADMMASPSSHSFMLSTSSKMPGNAALRYLALQPPAQENTSQRVDGILEVPVAELGPTSDALLNDGVISIEAPRLDVLTRAARCDDCDWDWDLSLGYELELPHLAPIRQASRTLAARIRVNAGAGNFDAAIADLQTGFAVARHLGEGDFLIELLVANAITRMMLDQASAMTEVEGCPNLYDALTLLGPTFLDARHAVDIELQVLYEWYPLLDDARSGAWANADWTRNTDELQRILQEIRSLMSSGSETGAPTTVKLDLVRLYPFGRSMLLARGVPEAEVDAMPTIRVAMEWMLNRHDETRHMLQVAASHCPTELAEAIADAERVLENDDASNASSPLSASVPMIGRVSMSLLDTDRRIAAMRQAELLRHAWAKGDTLDIVPRLNDPLTGRPFDLRKTSERSPGVTITAPGRTSSPTIDAIELRMTPAATTASEQNKKGTER